MDGGGIPMGELKGRVTTISLGTNPNGERKFFIEVEVSPETAAKWRVYDKVTVKNLERNVHE